MWLQVQTERREVRKIMEVHGKKHCWPAARTVTSRMARWTALTNSVSLPMIYTARCARREREHETGGTESGTQTDRQGVQGVDERQGKPAIGRGVTS